MPAPNLTADEVAARIGDYRWYHAIEVAGEVTSDIWTRRGRPQDDQWARITAEQAALDLRGKTVLDVGCRDGLFSFAAERAGATRVIAIDNDLSAGATELLIPFFQSKVEMHELNLYDLTPETFGLFDVILCYGVLYHLRYPVYGLRKLVDALADGGILALETAVLSDRRFCDEELMLCSVDASPYAPDWTSCTFFTPPGLEVTLRSLGMRQIHSTTIAAQLPSRFRETRRALARRFGRGPKPDVARQYVVFQKDPSVGKPLDYWGGVHRKHSLEQG